MIRRLAVALSAGLIVSCVSISSDKDTTDDVIEEDETAGTQPTATITELGYCFGDGGVEVEHNGYRGAGYVNTDNEQGVELSWQVQVVAAGSYRVDVRYANAASARGASLTANGSSRGTAFSFDSTDGWTSWKTETRTVALAAGSNRLVLTADTEGGLPNIDSVEVVEGSSADCSDGNSDGLIEDPDTDNENDNNNDTDGTGTFLTLEEDSPGYCRADGVIEDEHEGFFGIGYINSDNDNGAAIEWQVNAEEAINSEAIIRFANASTARGATLVVNGNSGSAVVYNLNTTDGWTDWTEESQEIVLLRGINWLVLSADTSAGLPNIDSIQIGGAGVSPDDCLAFDNDSE